MNYEVGSMWRRWDLHVHTPYSILNNQFGDKIEKYIHDLFSKAIKNKIFVIGVTDYYSIEGYKVIKEFLSNTSKLMEIFAEELKNDKNYLSRIKEITLFPNIEFRLNNVINYESRDKQSKVQIHVIFSDEVSIDDIESQFLQQLHFRDGTSDIALSKTAIENFGSKMIKAGTCVPNEKNPLIVGYNAISVDLSDIVDRVNNYFKGRALIVGVDEDITKINWSNQAGAIRKNYFENCDAVFTPNANNIRWFSSDDAIETIGSKKSCIWGSDSHSFDSLFIPAENHYCWIKADTSFAGLKAAINSMNERIFIGSVPHELEEARKRANYSISSIYIGKNSEKDLKKKWFKMDYELHLNPYMITIIGNKGSGKSALADVISYLGNSYKLGKASFLNEQRFLKPNSKYYIDYKAYMKLYDKENTIIEKDVLGNSFSTDRPEIVQFLPQKYIEEVCNDLGEEFQEEIDNVIYSYIRPEKKLDSTNLKDLIEKLTKQIKDNISVKRNELNSINEIIISLENKNSNQYKEKINNQFVMQSERLRIHELNKPAVVDKPSDIESDQFSKLDYELAEYLQKIEAEIYEVQNQQNNIYNYLNQLSQFENSLSTVIGNIEYINNEYLCLIDLFCIKDDKKIINYKVNDQILKDKKMELLNRYKEFSEILNDQFDSTTIANLVADEKDYNKIILQSKGIKSLYAQKYFIECYKNRLQEFTTEKAKKYLKYVNDYNQWNTTRRMYIGEIPNTIDGESVRKYSDEINYVSTKLPLDLQSNKDKRKLLINDICKLYEDLRVVYQEIYSPVQNKIDSILNNDEEKIEFRVNTYPIRDLASRIINYMNQRVASEFKGVTEGYEKVNSYIKETDFDNTESICNFISTIYEETSKAKDLNNFIFDRKSFYNYVGGLEYINVNYSLTLGGKKLDELSPGERGIVLLVFYLALSKSNLPLIIDQPEDNLDNQSVYKRLVPCIKTAKKNRQIIVVTHNPNIAVACDSEQIIYTHMNKENFEISYETGSLENPVIRGKVIDILEGTMPAFDMRRYKYLDEIKKSKID